MRPVHPKAIQIPLNRCVLKQQPIITNKVAPARKACKNKRKVLARPGQIVYVIRNSKVQPMRVAAINDEYVMMLDNKDYFAALPENARKRKDYLLNYVFQPLVYKMGKWYAQPYRAKHKQGWLGYNSQLPSSGWMRGGKYLAPFAHTCAEANWMLMS